MPEPPAIVDLTPENLEVMRCCGVTNPAHEGRRAKNCWFRENFKRGLRAKVLVAPDGRQCGYIEYVPGEYAWRGVDARGYLFIHCIWNHFKQYQGKGHGSAMVQAVVRDAAATGMKGVAVVARTRPWLADAALFQRNGFEALDTAPPDYLLLVRKLDAAAPNPSFKTGWEERLAKHGRGLTIIRSNQCPHIAKFAGEIAESAAKDYGIEPRIVELKSHRDAQNAPTPYAVFSILYDGRVIADHQVSRTRFHNIMKKVLA
jgi:L-amino acid N-acyltransferase YncA